MILFFIFAFAISLLAASCATQKKVPYKRLPPKGQRPAPSAPAAPTPEIPPPPEMRRTNATPSTADVMTPKRHASMRLVEKGKPILDAENAEQAANIFRDAINIDASNGIAYYYLAAANAKLGETETALGLLDKTEALLGADEEWMKKIEELRSEIGAAYHE